VEAARRDKMVSKQRGGSILLQRRRQPASVRGATRSSSGLPRRSRDRSDHPAKLDKAVKHSAGRSLHGGRCRSGGLFGYSPALERPVCGFGGVLIGANGPQKRAQERLRGLSGGFAGIVISATSMAPDQHTPAKRRIRLGTQGRPGAAYPANGPPPFLGNATCAGCALPRCTSA
jgi:hypothetical protein